ncbi:MAG: DNA polymerase III subunit chi [Rubrivivax sp.]|nr:DNA polymerase III subunit chi [Rubrivivax sp.]
MTGHRVALTEVEFHTGVADVIDFACRLLRKAARQGVRVQVTAPAAAASTLDRSLWTFDERDFVPHVRMPGATAAVAALSPIWLVDSLLAEPAAPSVLVNLGAPVQPLPALLERVIEIVGADADAADAGRERWRQYKTLGLAIRHYRVA